MNPVTPQRLHRSSAHSHSQSISHSHFRSPDSPASSPYTPLSLRSFASSTPGSTLNTPASVKGYSAHERRLSFASSPNVSTVNSVSVGMMSPNLASNTRDKSIADIADNWRERASENGIKVSSAADRSLFGDDEVGDYSFSDANGSGFITTEEALLPPPFMSTHRRRALSHSQVVSMPTAHIPRTPVSQRLPPTSPLARRNMSARNPNNTMNTINTGIAQTPPPNRNLAKQLKLKGSYTDPAQTRRREAFGLVPQPSQNIPATNPDMSLDLFDIDENDFEYECEYAHEQYMIKSTSNSNSARNYELLLRQQQQQYESRFHQQQQQQNQQPQNLLHHQPDFAHPYPIVNNAHNNNTSSMPLFGQPALADPFSTGLNSAIAESVDQQFQQYQQRSQQVYQNQNQNQRQFGPRSDGLTQAQSQSQPQTQSHPQSHNTHNTSTSTSTPSFSTSAQSTLSNLDSSTTGLSDVNEEDVARPTPTTCSVCNRANPARLAILSPCAHPLCSACLTSALNIVGEKDMECAVCKRGVDDFKLIVAETGTAKEKEGEKKKEAATRKPLGDFDLNISSKSMDKRAERKKQMKDEDEMSVRGKSFFLDPLFSSPGSAVSGSFTGGLDSAFELLGASFGSAGGDGGMRTSTPPPGVRRASALTGISAAKESMDSVVLRIDNVPWDITPPTIAKWLQQPIERAHVLLDRKGKTMSHAFVEVRTAEVAGAILRGETSSHGNSRGDIGLSNASAGSQRGRGAVLGRGRRARGVTITRSSQEELMAALFPSWLGTFDGSRPSLAGLESDRVIGALESGLFTGSEVSALLYLIRSPDAHFLKVPCLPFHSLISILSKFPADVDSRVFWSGGLRDMLYDVTFAAVQVLLNRIEEHKKRDVAGTVDNAHVDYDMDLVEELVRTAVQCQAFTTQQSSQIANSLDSHRDSSSDEDGSNSASYNPDADVEDEGDDDDDDDPRFMTPGSSTTAASTSSSEPHELESNDNGRAQANVDATSPVPSPGSIGDLAREFGVEAHLVQALAQRLAEGGLR